MKEYFLKRQALDVDYLQHNGTGIPYLKYRAPARFRFGYDDLTGEEWMHSFCVVDDFGNAVPVSPFLHDDDHRPYMTPGPNGMYEELIPDCH